ncbi:hypothetical protein HZY91_10670 [Facklamia sp. DSM 111018]|uniref:HTH cro/C1-type domain-containing protein n=1 Tax=Facklamia lactis TaxID=2749967 RepID=A0ABS0LT79_9LACT|nr:hypothetical protein [Facklamia lactis]MBG9987329.1 hypothetical protein [Facklamia lactis]
MLGEVIDEIRCKKGLTIKEMLGSKLSRSAYDAFRSDSMNLRVEHFMCLLNRLHVIPIEVILLSKELSKLSFFLNRGEKLVSYYNKQDKEALLAERAFLKEANLDSKFVQHMFWALDFFIADLEKQTIPEKEMQRMKQFFLEIETWYRYELYLFAGIGELFLDGDFLRMVLSALFKQQLNINSKKQALALNCLHTVFLNALTLRDQDLALHTLNLLLEAEIHPNLTYEKHYTCVLRLMYCYFLEEEEESLDLLNNYYRILSDLHCDHIFRITWEWYEKFCLIYEKPMKLKRDVY